jgi:hypothetical protein
MLLIQMNIVYTLSLYVATLDRLCRSRTSRMRLLAAFRHCAKRREDFFRSGTVAHLQTTHFSTNLHVPGMRLLSQLQLNQTSPNGIFVLLPYCISFGTRNSDVPTLPHYSTKSPKFRPLTDKYGKAVRLCTMAESRVQVWHNLSITLLCADNNLTASQPGPIPPDVRSQL